MDTQVKNLLVLVLACVLRCTCSDYIGSGNSWPSVSEVEKAIKDITLPTEPCQFEDIEISAGDTIGDIILTQDDIEMFHPSENHTNQRRKKRKVRNFDYEPSRKWPLPIKYAIDKNAIRNQTYWNMIRRAVKGWQQVTCIDFEEVNDVENIEERYLFFTNSTGHGCSSFIGKATVLEIYSVSNARLNMYSQPIYLENHGCFDTVGQVMHEIGHALGLYHEAQRLDRTNHIIVLLSNVKEGEMSNFMQPEYMLIDQKDIPYDLGSIMQYASLDFSVNLDSYKFTSIPRDTAKVFVMGQRVEIGFYDAKVLNQEYCGAPRSLPCENGGYTDPRDWSKCRCPEDWIGKYCQHLNPGNADCSPIGGIIKHTHKDVGKVFSLYSPNYLNPYEWSFDSGDECFWIIKAPRRYQISWWLGTEAINSSNSVFFGMLISGQAGCQAWLEIKTPGDVRGIRLCGVFNGTEQIGNWSNPTMTYSRQLHISFRSFDVFLAPLEDIVRRGFHLKYKIVANSRSPSSSRTAMDKSLQTIQDLWESLLRTTPMPVPVFHDKKPPRKMSDWWKWPYNNTDDEPPTTPNNQHALPWYKLFSITTKPATTTTTTIKTTTTLYVEPPPKEVQDTSEHYAEVQYESHSVTYTLIGGFVVGCIITVVTVAFLCYFKKNLCGKKKEEIDTVDKSCLCEKQRRIALLTPEAYDKEGHIRVDVVSVM